MKYIFALFPLVFIIQTSFYIGKLSRINEEHKQFTKCQELTGNPDPKLYNFYKATSFEILYMYNLGIAYNCVLKNGYSEN